MTQKNLPTQTAQRSFYTPKLYTQKLYPEQLLHTHTQKPFRTEAFPHRNLYAQKSLCTAVFTQALLPKDAFTQKTFTHRHFCAQHTFTHSQLLHGEALLPVAFPLSSLTRSDYLGRACPRILGQTGPKPAVETPCCWWPFHHLASFVSRIWRCDLQNLVFG